ncbi:MAG: flagellar basal body P-ring formation protein FlgA [Acidobacteria bacterium]|nr:flagellar basal body P-ring formation protein FlgA [Acidobacteriota bacterium]
MMPILWLAWIGLGWIDARDCVLVRGEFVHAADLAPHVAGFAELDPDLALFRTPSAGVRRWLPAAELAGILRKYGAGAFPEEPLCVIAGTRRLAREELITAMRQAWPDLESLTLEIVDWNNYPVPEGKLEFSPNGLTASAWTDPDQVVLWRGRVVAGDHRSVPVWARVRMSVVRTCLVAGRRIEASRILEAGDLRLEDKRISPLAGPCLTNADEVAGRRPRRAVSAGQPLTTALFGPRREIEAKAAVKAVVERNGVRLELPVIAESPGRVGELIWVRRVSGGSRFRGRVAGPDKVLVEVTKNATAQDLVRDAGAGSVLAGREEEGNATALRH